MTGKYTSGKNITMILSNSMMVILTLIFVLLYSAAFTGKFDPLKDNTMLLRLEPITFILIGFYFGRMPSWQNERSLKDEIERQTQKADAAQYSKEKLQQEREALEEKIKNVKASLTPLFSESSNKSSVEYAGVGNNNKIESLNHILVAVLNILDS